MKRLLIPLLAALALPNPLFADHQYGYEKEKECFSENGYDTSILMKKIDSDSNKKVVWGTLSCGCQFPETVCTECVWVNIDVSYDQANSEHESLCKWLKTNPSLLPHTRDKNWWEQ